MLPIKIRGEGHCRAARIHSQATLCNAAGSLLPGMFAWQKQCPGHSRLIRDSWQCRCEKCCSRITGDRLFDSGKPRILDWLSDRLPILFWPTEPSYAKGTLQFGFIVLGHLRHQNHNSSNDRISCTIDLGQSEKAEGREQTIDLVELLPLLLCIIHLQGVCRNSH